MGSTCVFPKYPSLFPPKEVKQVRHTATSDLNCWASSSPPPDLLSRISLRRSDTPLIAIAAASAAAARGRLRNEEEGEAKKSRTCWWWVPSSVSLSPSFREKCGWAPVQRGREGNLTVFLLSSHLGHLVKKGGKEERDILLFFLRLRTDTDTHVAGTVLPPLLRFANVILHGQIESSSCA